MGKEISCYLLNNAFLDLVSFIHIRSFDASSGTRFEPVFTPLSSSMLKNFFKTLTCRVFNNLFNSWKIPNGTQEQFLLLLLSSHSLTISREISKTEQINLDKLVEKSYSFVFETLRDFAFLWKILTQFSRSEESTDKHLQINRNFLVLSGNKY